MFILKHSTFYRKFPIKFVEGDSRSCAPRDDSHQRVLLRPCFLNQNNSPKYFFFFIKKTKLYEFNNFFTVSIVVLFQGHIYRCEHFEHIRISFCWLFAENLRNFNFFENLRFQKNFWALVKKRLNGSFCGSISRSRIYMHTF